MMENTLLAQVLNLERMQALETWLKETKTKLKQVNGQRKYGGPPEVWDGPTPGAHCEVFISQIPRDSYEDLLIPLFSSVGPLWEFRLMMNFSGQNRGFAYAKYGSSIVAAEAIRSLHGHMLEPGFRLSVCRSTEKRQLCIGNLPDITRQGSLLQVLRVLAEGVERLSLKAGPGIEGMSAIVTFSSHHAASMAKRVLVEAFRKQFSLDISIKWQSAVRPSQDAPVHPHRPSQSPLKLPRHILSSPQPSVVHSCMARPPSSSVGFSRAVGGPIFSQHPPTPSSVTTSSSFQGHPASTSSPVTQLHRLCEDIGLGQPLYKMCCSHTGPDGFLCFAYKVYIPGITTVFNGLVMILPGPTGTATLEEAKRAAAQQVLHMVYKN